MPRTIPLDQKLFAGSHMRRAVPSRTQRVTFSGIEMLKLLIKAKAVVL